MEYIHHSNFIMKEPCVVTFGKFDGLHKGHQLLIDQTVLLARQLGVKSMLCSFDFSFLKSGQIPIVLQQQLTTVEERNELCEQYGLDYVYHCPFDDALAATSPEAFLEKFVSSQLKAVAVVVGEDWHFGAKRKGDVTLLHEYAKQYGYQAYVYPKECASEEAGLREISSSWIRKLLMDGHMEKVTELLGHPYVFCGEVCKGQQLGRTISFPTLNLYPEESKQLPPKGVYESLVQVDGKQYKGVTNIGERPTVSREHKVSVETFLLDYEGDLYHQQIQVFLCHFEREEKRFENLEALQKQLSLDVVKARLYFENKTCNP